MPYRYTLGIDARGRGYREAKITAKSDVEVRKVCNLLLEHGTKVTILKKTKITSKK